MIVPQTKNTASFIIDELAVLLILFSIAVLGLAMVLFQSDPVRGFRATLMLVLLLAGFILSLVAGAKIGGEFTYKNMVMVFLLGFPLFALGAISVLENNSVNFTYQMIAFGTMVAVNEELFFRGGIYMLMKKMLPGRMGMIIALFGSSFLFGIYHTWAYGYNLTALLFPVMAGIWFALSLDLSKRLSVPIVIHALYDILIAIASGGGMLF